MDASKLSEALPQSRKLNLMVTDGSDTEKLILRAAITEKVLVRISLQQSITRPLQQKCC